MARIRTIKPEIARHEGLFEAEHDTGLPLRFAWAVLPTACDRAGRFKWRPRAMKPDILPYDEVDFEQVLDAFLVRGFLLKYRVGREWFGCIPTFTKHQHVNPKEAESALPSPDHAEELAPTVTRPSRVPDASTDGKERKGRELEQEGNGTSRADERRSRFERFWDAYPRKTGKDAAWREWLKRSPSNDLTEQMIAKVHEHKASPQWIKDGGQFIPHPRTWLHQGRWQDGDDEIPFVTAKTVNVLKGLA